MSEWISVKDQLPEIFLRGALLKNACSKDVLVTDGEFIQVGCRWRWGEEEYFLPHFRDYMKDITHWQPLPDFPEMKNQ